MAIELASMGTLGLMDQIQSEEWLDRFLSSGCILASDSETVWVGWGDVRRSSTPSSSRLSLFAPDFLLEDLRPWFLFEFGASIGLRDLADRLNSAPTHPNLQWEQPSFEEFSEVFDDIQHHIARGDLSKAVPVIIRSAAVRVDPALRLRTVLNALEIAQTSSLLPYGFWTEDGEGMIGATPEILFDQTSPQDLETMALAGTRRLDKGGESLLDDPKEMFEHQVVVDGIVNRLERFGTVKVEQTKEIRLPALIHLHTGISVHSDSNVAFGEWVDALHPTPAIGAWPREQGWKWLRSQATANSRRRYGAPFAIIPPGETSGRCVVAIRNLQWEKGEAWVMAGCGIVGASQLDREWSELHAKLDSVQGALGL
jgi:menaquinone-specific isochorismate synthase